MSSKSRMKPRRATFDPSAVDLGLLDAGKPEAMRNRGAGFGVTPDKWSSPTAGEQIMKAIQEMDEAMDRRGDALAPCTARIRVSWPDERVIELYGDEQGFFADGERITSGFILKMIVKERGDAYIQTLKGGF